MPNGSYKRVAIAGATLAAALCLFGSRAFAQMMEAEPRASSSAGRWSPPSILQGGPEKPSTTPQTSNELTLPSVTNQQASLPPPSKPDNIKVIPVIPPNQDVLVLPKASRDFLGVWGGRLRLVNKFGELDVPQSEEIGFTFGERDGQVVLATTVFANPNAQIIERSVESDGPNKVQLRIAGLHLNEGPPIRHVETITMEYTGNNQVRCKKRADLYMSGSSHPFVEYVYEGTLGPNTSADEERMARQLLREGDVPRARIDEGNPPPSE